MTLSCEYVCVVTVALQAFKLEVSNNRGGHKITCDQWMVDKCLAISE